MIKGALLSLLCLWSTTADSANPTPNVLVFLVDDLGWNQVGYHALAAGNLEVKTPHIDKAAAGGIELNRGYVTPWCGPSRAAIMTGRTNVYNANISQKVSTFDDDIVFVVGLPIGTKTIASAFKAYGASIGKNYTAYYDGKWGIGGTAWANTPLGMGFDNFRGGWGTGLETCDGTIPLIGVTTPFSPDVGSDNFGPLLVKALPGYWEQNPKAPDSDMCTYFNSLPNEKLTPAEKAIACKTYPRTPPKIIDLDLLDKVTDQIKTHDYDKGPFLQVFATMMMHMPMAYPAKYNEAAANDNYANGMPPHFAGDKVKPPATNDDHRWATNKALSYIDDVFGATMQAIKDAGQWNNTIVYFTSDNGGAIYHGTVNNNYPLRSSKFSPFEGGIRVPQFISGGWIDQQLPENRKKQSNTYLFPNDIAPTLLEMAGAERTFLLGNNTGAPYGNAMWKYIKNSVNPAEAVESHQKIRKVSYTPDFFFDVQVNKTMKFFFTGSKPMTVPRLYEPVWPKNGDFIMDTLYYSVHPCRPNGVPSDCCSWDIESDWQERKPLSADCGAMYTEAKTLFEIEGGCPKDSAGRHLNHMCLEHGAVSKSVSQNDLTLWSHYGSSGPFTNSKGQPINELPMKCICHGLRRGTFRRNVDYFVVRNLGPSECGKSKFFGRRRPALSIPCDGSFALDTPPKRRILNEYEKEGFPKDTFDEILRLEERRLTATGLPLNYELMNAYMNRKGSTDWPSVNKFPLTIPGTMDTCKEKGVVPVPFPVLAVTPYLLSGSPDPTLSMEDASPIGLCVPISLRSFICPSHQNAALQSVAQWVVEGDTAYGLFVNGSKWQPLGLMECGVKCSITPNGTSYIGEGPNGLVV